MKRLSIILCSIAISGFLFAQEKEGNESKSKLNSGTLSALKFRNVGPALTSGRVSDIAIDPTRSSTWYVTAASGGVWKTVNAGTSFQPIFDGQGSYSIG